MVPVIALVLITILNDGAMLTLAYDNVIPQSVEEKFSRNFGVNGEMRQKNRVYDVILNEF